MEGGRELALAGVQVGALVQRGPVRVRVASPLYLPCISPVSPAHLYREAQYEYGLRTVRATAVGSAPHLVGEPTVFWSILLGVAGVAAGVKLGGGDAGVNHKKESLAAGAERCCEGAPSHRARHAAVHATLVWPMLVQ